MRANALTINLCNWTLLITIVGNYRFLFMIKQVEMIIGQPSVRQ